MATEQEKLEALEELYRRGALKGEKRAAFEELARRGGASEQAQRLVKTRTTKGGIAQFKLSFGGGLVDTFIYRWSSDAFQDMQKTLACDIW